MAAQRRAEAINAMAARITTPGDALFFSGRRRELDNHRRIVA
jgi:hypothetical protein